ncbi:MAG: hypothetical protein IKF38_04880 [Clostridia bacterium]|nr:hypothetical protein [Clostridia bacterium]
MEDEEIVDLNSVIIGLRQELEQRKDIEEELNKNGIANTIIRTEYYTGILTIVEN